MQTLKRIAMIAAGAAALALGAAQGAAAQSDDRYPSDESASTLGGVTVIAPRHFERDSATGAPTDTVFAHRIVRYDDLDLSYGRDRHILHARIVRAAEAACRELDVRYPVTASASPPCVREAVQRAMDRVDLAEDR